MPLEVIKYVNAIQANYSGTQKGVLRTVITGASQAKALAPVDDGELRNSMGYSTELADGGYNQDPGKKTDRKITSKGSGTTGFYGSGLEYSLYVERGTRRMVAQPFLEPSAEILKRQKTAKEVAEELEKDFKSQVREGTRATRI